MVQLGDKNKELKNHNNSEYSFDLYVAFDCKPHCIEVT